MNEKAHINENDLIAFRSNTMQPDRRLSFLEHIGSCTYCSDKLAAFLSDDLIAAPKDMKTNILKAVRHEYLIKDTVKEVSKRMQLLIYSLKVGAATSLALLLLILTMNISNTNIINENIFISQPIEETQKLNPPITLIIREGMDAFCNSLIDFSNSFIK